MSSSATHGGLQVTLEPFSSHSSGGGGGDSVPFLTTTGNLAVALSPSSTPLPQLQRDSSLLKDINAVNWNTTPLPSPTGNGGSSAMDVEYEHKSAIAPSPAAVTGTSTKDSAAKEKEKDSKYLENFLASLSGLPDFITDKVGRIKGLERAVIQKTAALKDASAYHVQMIHLKLTPKKPDSEISPTSGQGNANNNSFNSFGTSGSGQGDSSSNNNNNTSSSNSGSLSNTYNNSSYNTGGNSGNFPNNNSSSNNSNSFQQGGGGGNNFNNSSFNTTNLSASANLPPLPHPSPLSAPLPYTLTAAVVTPLPTENLLNSLTYLLVGPVVHSDLMLSSNAPPAVAAAGASGAPGGVHLSRQEMGIMPMNISPAAAPPVGKKTMTAAAQAACAHPYASIPSPAELASTAVLAAPVDTPKHLSNDALDLRKRWTNTSDYDLNEAEKVMREHQATLLEWQRRKAALVTEVYGEVDALLKRADAAVKKQESKLRRGAFEVPATPIDRRRTTTAATTTTTTVATTSAASAAASAQSAAEATRKRSYSLMVHELESRELQYSLQNELRLEIEKQSANAIAHSAATAAAAATASSTSGGSATPAAETEPVYCTCKKVSFGAMVACDNEDCEIEWYHFACAGLSVKPRGKWICAECKRKEKTKKAKTAKDEKGSESASSSKDKEKELKESSSKKSGK